ncbi:MAG: FAD-binding protein [Kiritimatiellae bacterium]|nr:FAD-binding protein [Kiritimatiellia bacterium]
MKTTNWNNYPHTDATIIDASNDEALSNILSRTTSCIPRGLGRCYGDASLQSHILSTDRLNRFLSFEPITGTLTCEAGVSFAEILTFFVPRGWFPPVTPGTKFITVGGAIASDIHGKNHHRAGTFCEHIESITLKLSNGQISQCSLSENKELFHATCGGMGLTGLILQATFKLTPIESAYIKEEVIKAKDIDEIMDLFEASAPFPYSVAWIDCLAKGKQLGRSIMMRGGHARLENCKGLKNPFLLRPTKPINIPFFLPDALFNKWTIKSFNALYYHKKRTISKLMLVDYDTFFYPLDRIYHWNRMYGKRGFIQYQFVLPKPSSCEGIKKILNKIGQEGKGSFLAVLKLFGKANQNVLSFPMEGYTLALDFPLTDDIFDFLDRLDTIVLDYGGRIYLTKDARMKDTLFSKTYTNLSRFLTIKKEWDKAGKFQSMQSKRLGIL